MESLICPRRTRNAPQHGWPDRNRTAPFFLSTGVAIACSCLRSLKGRVLADMDATPNDRRLFSNEGSHESVIGITLRSTPISARETTSLAGRVYGRRTNATPRCGLVCGRKQEFQFLFAFCYSRFMDSTRASMSCSKSSSAPPPYPICVHRQTPCRSTIQFCGIAKPSNRFTAVE